MGPPTAGIIAIGADRLPLLPAAHEAQGALAARAGLAVLVPVPGLVAPEDSGAAGLEAAALAVPEAAPVGSGAAASEVPVGAASAAAGAVVLAAPGAAASGN